MPRWRPKDNRPLVPRNPATAEASETYEPNCGVNPPGNIFWKVKQLGSLRDLIPCRLVDHEASLDPDFRAPGRSVRHAIKGVEHVADEKGAAASIEHAAAGVRITEVEAALDLLAGVVAMPVEQKGVAEEVGGIRKLSQP